jgi:Transglutaminase-like superfamily
MEMNMQSLAIPPHVHVCVTPEGCVLLDLKRDQYYGLGREDTEQLAATVSGWPPLRWEVCMDQSGGPKKQVIQTCKSLVDQGLLIRNSVVEKLTRHSDRIDMTAPFVSVGDELEVRGKIRLHHVASFVQAYVAARFCLGCRPFISIVEGIRRKKNHGPSAQEACDIFLLAKMVDIFRHLRPYCFGPEGRCLLHALTLIKFLSRYDLHPEWVIGVSTLPWAAHSWVQSGNFLLDTNPEKVCQYTPIMVV